MEVYGDEDGDGENCLVILLAGFLGRDGIEAIFVNFPTGKCLELRTGIFQL